MSDWSDSVLAAEATKAGSASEVTLIGYYYYYYYSGTLRASRQRNCRIASRLVKKTNCAGGRHNMPRPLQIDLRPFDLESGVRVM